MEKLQSILHYQEINSLEKIQTNEETLFKYFKSFLNQINQNSNNVIGREPQNFNNKCQKINENEKKIKNNIPPFPQKSRVFKNSIRAASGSNNYDCFSNYKYENCSKNSHNMNRIKGENENFFLINDNKFVNNQKTMEKMESYHINEEIFQKVTDFHKKHVPICFKEKEILELPFEKENCSSNQSIDSLNKVFKRKEETIEAENPFLNSDEQIIKKMKLI